MNYRVQIHVMVEADNSSEAIDAAFQRLAQERTADEIIVMRDFSPVAVAEPPR